jgi:lauroyl/myristoyl acyltransferase
MSQAGAPNRPALLTASRALQGFEYGAWLPFTARLPHRWGWVLTQARGQLNAAFDRDWTELALGQRYIRDRARAAYREMFAQAAPSDWARWTVERYQTIAREEFEGQLAIAGQLRRYEWNTAGLQPLVASRECGRGLVVVMPHLENLFLALLGVAKVFGPTHLMTSDVVEDPRVHPALRRFFARKYEAYQQHLHGGRFAHVGAAAKAHFEAALSRGEVVVVISDAPASADGPGRWVPWFGRPRKMADSAWRMAQETGAQIAGVATRRPRLDALAWCCTVAFDARAKDAPGEPGIDPYARIAAFMEAEIRHNPGGWWAAHLLQDFPVWADRQRPADEPFTISAG